MGHALVHRLTETGEADVVALDVRPLEPDLAKRCAAARVGDILDRRLLDRLTSEFEITTIFHLAALLSTRAEFVPETRTRYAEPAPDRRRRGARARPSGDLPRDEPPRDPPRRASARSLTS